MTNNSSSDRSRNTNFRDGIRSIFKGTGVDLGPWHMPFETPNARTLLCDRYSVEEMRQVFSEFAIDSDVKLPDSDVVSNFDLDGLSVLEDQSQDFVIASHLLEHLSQPFLFLTEINRVLKDEGLLLIALPDKRYTFDKNRVSEPFSHYVAEMEKGWTIPDSGHVDDYIVNVIGKPKEFITQDDRSVELARSFHVHVFTDSEFMKVLRKMIFALNLPFEFVDGSRTNTFKGTFEEFLILIRKVDSNKVKFKTKSYWRKWICRG